MITWVFCFGTRAARSRFSPSLLSFLSPSLPSGLALQISGTAAALEQKSHPDWLRETAEAYASTTGTITSHLSKTGSQAPSAAAA